MNALDPAFPALHGRPAQGWLNDPNGCAYVDGVYHVFFQYYPDQPTHRDIHWGHMTSTDLVRWHQRPIALFPRPGGPDAIGAWSGVVALDGRVPTAFYTGIAERAEESQVVTAISDRDLLVWKQAETGIVGMPDEPDLSQVRDPFLFTFEGQQYAIQGAGRTDGTPLILLYRCRTMTDWEYLGPLVEGGSGLAEEYAPCDVWECPQLFQVDGQWVLMVSLWLQRNGVHRHAGVTYLSGELRPGGAGLVFEPVGGGRADLGPDFYAPQVMAATAEEPRTLLWAWSWDASRPEAEVEAAGWAGVLTYARSLSFRDGVLRSEPVAEVLTLRDGVLFGGTGVYALPAEERAFEVVAEGPVELVLVDGDDVRSMVGITSGRILVDGSLVECFGAEVGVKDVSRTVRTYPTGTSHFEIRGEGPFAVYRLGL
ncbi:glycoside hydrolase family 32 protein [Psychromicrobium xiongbiense]|uniref:glycoside hydrolase family 32 protein n=1 Tax=Psychromicrobium xiongbiense TaxID=3051184 RepID=UPI0025573EBE|nr:glycoside hydrolase family 32 protein [Psychromicrobium sp. YIM S02556]